MTSLVEQLEQMRMRMNELAKQESNLVATLSDSLRHADQQLLQEVRRLSADHEERRSTILGELQMLATRLNSFPSHAGHHVSAIGADQRRGLLPGGTQPAGHHNGHQEPLPADWEQRSAEIRDALNQHLGRRFAS